MHNFKPQISNFKINKKNKLLTSKLGFGIYFEVLGLMLVVLFLAVGCSSQSTTTYYNYSPSWTRDAKVVFIAGAQTTGQTYTENIKTIYSTGTGESSSFKDVSDEPAYQMSCSPTRNYVAYLTDLSSSAYRKIIIHNISAESHTGAEDVEIIFSPRIKSFDWSANGNQLVYCTTDEVRVRDWNDYTGSTDTLVTSEASLSFVSWQYGGRIAFVHNSLLSLIYADGSGRLDLASALSVDKPQISSANTLEVYGVVGSTYVKVDTSALTSTEVKSSFSGNLPRLSPAGDRIVYSKTGTDTGVYILYVATGTEESFL